MMKFVKRAFAAWTFAHLDILHLIIFALFKAFAEQSFYIFY